jgi:hypothetical protein
MPPAPLTIVPNSGYLHISHTVAGTNPPEPFIYGPNDGDIAPNDAKGNVIVWAFATDAGGTVRPDVEVQIDMSEPNGPIGYAVFTPPDTGSYVAHLVTVGKG